jgi:hypothetical protein
MKWCTIFTISNIFLNTRFVQQRIKALCVIYCSGRMKQWLTTMISHIELNPLCGNGLLCLAAKKGHLMCLTMLLPEQNIGLNKWNEFGSTPLHSAIDGDNVEGLSILLSTKGIDVNAIDELFGMTPLHYAIRNEKIACAKVIRNLRSTTP